jgi:hypothetical protein
MGKAGDMKEVRRSGKLKSLPSRLSRAMLLIAILCGHATGQSTARPPTTRPEIIKNFTAVEQTHSWNGWARDDKSIPGWGNKPPEPGTVNVIKAEAGAPRTFSGRVDGLDSFIGAEVGVVSLTYIYWNRPGAYHWTPVADDGTFNISESTYPDENKAIILRAPGHPWTFLNYIFKGREGGKEIVLHAEPGKAVRVTMEVAGTASQNFDVECFSLNSSWIHGNNPIGYQWASRAQTTPTSDGRLTIYFPLRPMAVYVGADGGANDWEIVDARQADHFHFILLPEAHFNLLVTDHGLPAPKTNVLMGNDMAALSLRSGATDQTGQWHASRLPPGRWWISIGKQTMEFNLWTREAMEATYDAGSGKFSTNR